MSATPDWVGQVYKDTGTGNIWKANSTTPGDWSLEVQKLNLEWEPRSIHLGEMIGLVTKGNIAGLTTLRFLSASPVFEITLYGCTDLTTVHFDVLTAIDPSSLFGCGLAVISCGVTSLSLPLLQSVSAGLNVQDCPSLASISAPVLDHTGQSTLEISGNNALTTIILPSLVSVPYNVSIQNNPLLTSINLQSWLPEPTFDHSFLGNALSQSCVDAILSRGVANAAFVSGSIDLSGGTNSPPSLAGLADKATLEGRVPGVTVLVNP